MKKRKGKGEKVIMRTMLTLKRMFLGLNGIAINGKGLTIKIKPEYNKYGNVKYTKWELSDCDFSSMPLNDGEENEDPVCIKDFLAGVRIDDDANNVAVKFFDSTGKHPRYIADRIPTASVALAKRKRTGKSAFSYLIDIIRAYYTYIDDDVIDILKDERIMKVKCKLSYPLLVSIPDDVVEDTDLLKNFLSLARPGEEKVRYWKKILILNGKRFWLSNHIFHRSLKPFKELMVDLTGIDFTTVLPNNEDENDIKDELKEQNDLKMEKLKELFNQMYEDAENVDDLLLNLNTLVTNSLRDQGLLVSSNNNTDEENEEEELIDITENNEKENSEKSDEIKVSNAANNKQALENIMGSMFSGFGI